MIRNLSDFYSRINLCYKELDPYFSYDQSFEIIAVMLTIAWIKDNKNYCDSTFLIERCDEKGFVDNLTKALIKFEKEHGEFQNALTELINNAINYPDININKILRNIYELISEMHLDKHMVKSVFQLILSSEAEFNRSNDTPDSVIELIYRLVDIDKVRDMAVYCCGCSKIAITFSENIRKTSSKQLPYYHGEEIVLSSTLVSKLLMIIFELRNSNIVNRDVLLPEENLKNGSEYDLVISDMPQSSYSEENSFNHDFRLKYGKPVKNSAEWAFGQNVIYNMNSNGIGILIGTKGALVRGSESEIRKNIINDDLIECIITLPNSLYEKSNLGSEIIILNKNKSHERRDKILFINASQNSIKINRMQYAIPMESIDEIAKAYKEGIEKKHFSMFVDIGKIKDFGYRINPIEYLDFDAVKKSFLDTVLLKDIAEVKRGLNVKNEDVCKDNSEGYLCLNIKEIENGRVNYDSAVTFQHVKREWVGRYDIKPNDILVTSKGWSLKFAIVENEFKPSLISSNLTIIRVDQKRYNPYVLFEFFQSEIGMKMINGIHTGTTVKILNNSQLQNFEIPTFGIDEMNRLGEKIKNNRMEYIKSINEAKTKFEENKKSYVEKMWSLFRQS
ncbi:N-6 DNA methylase [Lacrimispora indolis]|uniref:N-6 DNA methylase n=1 Tax=Lacrimispora indolis TaxID=69825 RepID=UPI00045E697A|nr:N-6 DNA methylase [Lacrimispora indolis]